MKTSLESAEALPSFLLPAFHQDSQAHMLARRSKPLFKRSSRLVRLIPGQERLFSSSSVRRATVVTANPRKDDDGNDMHVDITARAAKVGPVSRKFAPILIVVTAPK